MCFFGCGVDGARVSMGHGPWRWLGVAQRQACGKAYDVFGCGCGWRKGKHGPWSMVSGWGDGQFVAGGNAYDGVWVGWVVQG